MLSASAVAAVGLTVATILVVALLVVVLRWRRRLQGSSDGSCGPKADVQQEMEWDNSALNITVNPLDVENGLEDDELELNGPPSHDLSDNDTVSAIEYEACQLAADEQDEQSQQTTKDKPECKELEWDDSTLSY